MKNKHNLIAIALLIFSVIILLYRFGILFPDEQNFRLEITVTGEEPNEENKWYFYGHDDRGSLKPVLFKKDQENNGKTTMFRFKNGKAIIKGYIKRPGLYVLTNEHVEGFFPFMIGTGEQQIEVTHQHLFQRKDMQTPIPFKFSGSNLNKEFIDFWNQKEAQQLLQANNEYFRLRQEMQAQAATSDTTSNSKIEEEKREQLSVQRKNKLVHLKKLCESVALNYLAENPNSYLALDYFLAYAYMPNYTKLDEPTMSYYISLIGDNLKKTAVYQSVEKKYRATQNFCVGKTPPPISLPDNRGDTAKLTHCLGNVTLVNFWAMDCDYCKAERSNMIELYAKYHEHDFNMLSIAFEPDKNRWDSFLKEKGLPWQQAIDTSGFEQSAIVKNYGGLAIPTSFLMDEEGKVLAKNLRCPAYAEDEKYNMNKQLEKIYGF